MARENPKTYPTDLICEKKLATSIVPAFAGGSLRYSFLARFGLQWQGLVLDRESTKVGMEALIKAKVVASPEPEDWQSEPQLSCQTSNHNRDFSYLSLTRRYLLFSMLGNVPVKSQDGQCG